jgi:hypothetical protein
VPAPVGASECEGGCWEEARRSVLTMVGASSGETRSTVAGCVRGMFVSKVVVVRKRSCRG